MKKRERKGGIAYIWVEERERESGGDARLQECAEEEEEGKSIRDERREGDVGGGRGEGGSSYANVRVGKGSVSQVLLLHCFGHATEQGSKEK